VANGQVRRDGTSGEVRRVRRDDSGSRVREGSSSGARRQSDPQRIRRDSEGRIARGGAPVSKKKNSSKKKKGKKGLAILIVELVVLAVLAVAVFAFAWVKMNLRDKVGSGLDNNTIQDTDDVYIDKQVAGNLNLEGYTNILLVGVDSRNAEKPEGNSDTMIIASINNSTGQVRMISILRDTYMNIMSDDNTDIGMYNKANNAYAKGGITRMLSMVNANLDLNITDYAVVDFRALAYLVDAIGGINISLTEQEAVHLNNYQVEISNVTGIPIDTLDVTAGQELREYTLSGIQAVAYCRIRYTRGWDAARTQRQRLVIQKIVDKVKSQGLAAAQSVIEEVLPYCYTNLSQSKIMSMASQMFNYEIEKTATWPFERLGAGTIGETVDISVAVTLELNVSELHQWLFDVESYEVSDTVKGFSDYIVNASGIGLERREEAIENSAVRTYGGEADTVK